MCLASIGEPKVLMTSGVFDKEFLLPLEQRIALPAQATKFSLNLFTGHSSTLSTIHVIPTVLMCQEPLECSVRPDRHKIAFHRFLHIKTKFFYISLRI